MGQTFFLYSKRCLTRFNFVYSIQLQDTDRKSAISANPISVRPQQRSTPKQGQ